MSEYSFKINLGGICSSEAYRDASLDELRVLLAIIDCGGRPMTREQLAEIAGVSPSRVTAARVYWQESGILSEGEGIFASVIDEYEGKRTCKNRTLALADTLYDQGLSDMFDSLSRIMERTLNDEDVDRITKLVTELGLDSEYILTLAKFRDTKNEKNAALRAKKKTKLTSGALCNEAKRLYNKDICDSESLNVHLLNTELSPEVLDLKYKMGISGRNLSETELELFTKWTESFGYTWNIISLAYNEAVFNVKHGSNPTRYMDSILTVWNEKELRTVEACRQESEAFKEKRRTAWQTKENKKATTPTREEPKYASFSSEDAIKKALLRSYGAGSEDN